MSAYAIFLAIYIVASFCGYKIGRLATLSECRRLLRLQALEHRQAMSLAVIKASRHAFRLARAGMEAAHRVL